MLNAELNINTKQLPFALLEELFSLLTFTHICLECNSSDLSDAGFDSGSFDIAGWTRMVDSANTDRWYVVRQLKSESQNAIFDEDHAM